jgi:predicted GTPase
MLVATKVEDEEGLARARELAKSVGMPLQVVSAATGQGLKDLVVAVTELLGSIRPGYRS